MGRGLASALGGILGGFAVLALLFRLQWVIAAIFAWASVCLAVYAGRIARGGSDCTRP